MRLPDRSRWLLAALLLAAVWPGVPLRAQARRAEPRGFDFAPQGVWRVKAARVREARLAALARGDVQSLNAALRTPGIDPYVLKDTLRVPVFLVRYRNTDVAALNPPARYDSVLLGATPPAGRPYTWRTFYEEMSGGRLVIEGRIIGWIALDSDDTWYEGSDNGLGAGNHIAQLIQEAVSKSDPSVDFGQFDNDGPDGVPNSGDDDGIVDLAVFIQPEVGGECGNNANIWSHRFFYAGWTGLPLATADAAARGGQVKVDSYTIQSGLGGATACDGATIMAPGTVAHETGHGFGLEDLYDTEPGDGDDSEGIGHWGLMSSGNYRNPESPAYMEGFSRLLLGWVTVRDLSAPGSYSLGPYATADTIVRIVPTGANPRNEYFLLENRQASGGSDTALVDSKGPGLLIYHVDQQKYLDGFYANVVNSGAIHALTVMEADGLMQMLSSTAGVRNRGDAGDPFPGSTGNTAFGYSTTPSTRLHAGGASPGFAIDSITQVVPRGPIAFRLRFGSLSTVRASDTAAAVMVRGRSYGVYREVFADGDTATISMDSAQVTGDGRSRFVFSSWSDGLARTHVATMGTGVVLTAQVVRQFMLTTTISGGGALRTAPAGAQGAFLDDGATVSIVAAPLAGFVFSGWSGDTLAAGDTLRLRMTRPWSVTANFLSPDSVVAQLLLGGSALPSAQARYLDQLGNANGVFDIGDFTAWVDRTGVAISPQVMGRIVAAMRAKR